MQQQIEKQYVENAVKTTSESVTYAKKLIAISFSYLCRKRFGLHEKFFTDRRVGNIKVPVLDSSKVDDNKPVTMMIVWMKATFDALEKGYFKFAIITMYDTAHPDEILETYKFKLKEIGIGVERKLNGVMHGHEHSLGLQDQAEDLLQNLKTVFKRMSKLPENYSLKYRLIFNSTAPTGYYVSTTLPCIKLWNVIQYDGMAPSTDFEMWMENAEKIMTTEINTGFHVIKHSITIKGDE